jgi:hypothetical protein
MSEDAVPTVTISTDSAQLMLEILGQVTLAVGSPDFDVMAPAIVKAKKELTQALLTNS